MTDHKFTDDEIIKALEICAKNAVGREGYHLSRHSVEVLV